ncbi:MAG: GNAT family N-acetyltransferase [Acaryochloridaceae cyanobacterium SU_2_1]|nr:GNAT family N-acetyltransferase [Acaryochloridaceae cyanobacterium SU_2_1]
MQSASFLLPSGYQIRPAEAADKWTLQKMVWQFTWDEGIGLDIRLFGYGFLRLAAVGIFLALLYTIPTYQSLPEEKILLLMLVGLATLGLGIALLTQWIGQLVLRFWGALIHGSGFQVIEFEQQLIGCALLNTYPAHAELAYLFVKPAERQQGLGSVLVQSLIQNAGQPVYLACKPKVLSFYRHQGFREGPWSELPPPVQQYFRLFRPHPRLWGFPLVFMVYEPPILNLATEQPVPEAVDSIK